MVKTILLTCFYTEVDQATAFHRANKRCIHVRAYTAAPRQHWEVLDRAQMYQKPLVSTWLMQNYLQNRRYAVQDTGILQCMEWIGWNS